MKSSSLFFFFKKKNHTIQQKGIREKEKENKKRVESECENKIDLFCDYSFIIGAKDELVLSSSFTSFYMYYKCTGHRMLLFSATTFVKSIFSTSLFYKGKKNCKIYQSFAPCNTALTQFPVFHLLLPLTAYLSRLGKIELQYCMLC